MNHGYIGFEGKVLKPEQIENGNWLAHFVVYGGDERKVFVEFPVNRLSAHEITHELRRYKPKLQLDSILSDYVLPTIERMLRTGERCTGTNPVPQI